MRPALPLFRLAFFGWFLAAAVITVVRVGCGATGPGSEGGEERQRWLMISIGGAVTVVLYLIIGGLVFWLLWWLVGYVGLPEPFNKVARVVLAILAVMVVIGILLSLVGGQALFRP